MKKAVLCSIVAACIAVAAPAMAALEGKDKVEAAGKIAGKQLYLEHCASCHGDTAAGNGPRAKTATIPDFTTPQAVVKFTFERMVAGVTTAHDEPTRAAWKGKLSEAETEGVVGFIREAFMLPAPTADASRGRTIYARTCSVCHGDRGNGASWAKNSLNPSPADFTAPKIRELSRRHMINTVTYGSPKTAMMGFSVQLSREEIAAVVDYVRSTFMFPGGIPEGGNSASANLNYGNRMLSSSGGHDSAPAEPGADPAANKHAQHGGHAGPADMGAPMPNGLVGDAVAGKAFFDKNCFTCHGKDGAGDGPRAYFIVPKPANFTSIEAREELNRPHLFAAISKGSQGTEMPAWSKVLSDQEIANVAEYVFVAFINKPTGEQPAAAKTSPTPGAAAVPEQKKNKPE